MFKLPAGRKQYPEDPAEFKPLTEDELQRIKKERRQKDLQRKQKAAENRKHLANVRVVQRNLVFVVGLSQRLADPEVLRRHDYFGKFGKIHKVVINQSTSYAGAQATGPSASAYVTYHRPEDALKAIQAVNNIHVDGRTLKASLGTTKYCSHFLRGAQCPKPDCMYLHELGEEAASFTKEEMQQGKHQEYEQRLYEQFMNSQNLANHHIHPTKSQSSRKKTGSPQTIQQQQPQPTSMGGPPAGSSPSGSGHPPPNSSKEAWPSLQPTGNGRPERLTNGNRSHTTHGGGQGSPTASQKHDTQNGQNRAPGHHRNRHPSDETEQPHSKTKDTLPPGSTQQNNRGPGPQLHIPSQPSSQPPHSTHPQQPPPLQQPAASSQQQQQQSPIGGSRRSPFENPADSMSLFSNGFPTRKPAQPPQHPESITTPEIPDTIPVSSSTDWQAAFGFTPSPANNIVETQEDDLGFDPWDESTKALADLIKKKKVPTATLR